MPGIHLSTEFTTGIKRKKLERRLGGAGYMAFIDMLLLVSEDDDTRADGTFGGLSDADVAEDIRYAGDIKALFNTLTELGLVQGTEGERRIADWQQYKPW